MKTIISILTLIWCLTLTACGQSDQASDKSYPKPTGFVNDFEQILDEDQEHELDSLINAFEKQTSIEISIVTLDTSFTTIEDFDVFTLGLANYWGVGKKDLDNGVLIGVSATMRTMRIQNGFGIEKVLSNEETKGIVDNFFIPKFKTGNYFLGIREGTLELMKRLN